MKKNVVTAFLDILKDWLPQHLSHHTKNRRETVFRRVGTGGEIWVEGKKAGNVLLELWRSIGVGDCLTTGDPSAI